MSNLQELPRLADSISYLYIEHAIIERDAFSVTAIRKDGRVPIPISSVTCLLLGPGTSITYAAVDIICGSGCSIVWCGENAGKFYASGTGETRSAANLLLQAKCCMNESAHMTVVRRMYALRFPDIPTNGLSLQQIRGMEGIRVRKCYEMHSRLTGVKWNRRNYKSEDWDAADPVNRALSEANALLYGVCHAAIVSLGFSPGLGFVHTGKQLSFVYDIADLYKTDTTIPTAFQCAKMSGDMHKNVRLVFRENLASAKILSRIPKDLCVLFDGIADEQPILDTPGDLWDDAEHHSQGGKNYGGEQ